MNKVASLRRAPVGGLLDGRFVYAPSLETDIRATFARAKSGDQPFPLPQPRKQAMNTTALTTVVLEPIELTEEQKAAALQSIDHLTVDVINTTLVARPVNLQSAGLVAKDTFSRAVNMLRTLTALRDAPLDCTNTAGDDAARAARLLLKTFRTRVDKLRLEATAPYRDQVKAHNDMADLIIDAVKPLESRFDDAIKAQEAVVAARRAAEQAKADERAREVAKRIADLNDEGDMFPNAMPHDIEERMANVRATELAAEDFDHRHGEAIALKDRVLARLQEALNRAIAAEEREHQIAKDRAAFEQQLAEQRKQIAAAAEQKRRDDDAAATRAAEADALRQREQEMRDQEAAARQRISDMRGIPAWALTATAEAIRAKQEELEDMNQGQFHPLEHEALAAHEEVTKALPVLLTLAEDKERTAAERARRELRIEVINLLFHNIGQVASLLSKPDITNKEIAFVETTLQDVLRNGEDFGDRLEEAKAIIAAQREHIAAARARILEQERQAAEAETRRAIAAAEEAARTHRDAVLRMNGEALHSLLDSVRDDANFPLLDADLQGRIQAKLVEIDAAL